MTHQLDEVIPAGRSKAYSKGCCNITGETSLFQVIDRLLCLWVCSQLLPVIFFSLFHQGIEGPGCTLSLFGWCRWTGSGNIDTLLSSQLFYRLDELHMLVLHQETDGRAMGTATEAVVELFGRTDGKGGGLFVVEGTTGLVFASGLFQRHARVDDIDNVDASDQIINKGLWNSSRHGASLVHHGSTGVLLFYYFGERSRVSSGSVIG